MIVTDIVGLRCVLGEHGGYKSKSSQNTTKQSEVYVDSWTPYQTLSEIDRNRTGVFRGRFIDCWSRTARSEPGTKITPLLVVHD